MRIENARGTVDDQRTTRVTRRSLQYQRYHPSLPTVARHLFLANKNATLARQRDQDHIHKVSLLHGRGEQAESTLDYGRLGGYSKFCRKTARSLSALSGLHSPLCPVRATFSRSCSRARKASNVKSTASAPVYQAPATQPHQKPPHSITSQGNTLIRQLWGAAHCP